MAWRMSPGQCDLIKFLCAAHSKVETCLDLVEDQHDPVLIAFLAQELEKTRLGPMAAQFPSTGSTRIAATSCQLRLSAMSSASQSL